MQKVAAVKIDQTDEENDFLDCFSPLDPVETGPLPHQLQKMMQRGLAGRMLAAYKAPQSIALPLRNASRGVAHNPSIQSRIDPLFGSLKDCLGESLHSRADLCSAYRASDSGGVLAALGITA